MAETAWWSTAANNASKWYQGIVEEADGLMVRWHTVEAEKSRLHHAKEDTKKGGKGMGRGGSRTDIAGNEKKNNGKYRVTKHQPD